MDVANYLSELLGELGEVNVPGLGYFATLRSDGYYNESENTFYPPVNHINFEPQVINDDVLANYIAKKKNISLASSKYFTQKYIDDLRSQVFAKETPLADLGTLYFQDGAIHFKPASALNNDPSLFGYVPVKMEKVGDTSVEELLRSMENGSYTPHEHTAQESPYTPTSEPEPTATKEPDYTPPPVAEEFSDNAPPIREEYSYIAPPEPVFEPEPRTIYEEPIHTFAPQEEEEEFVFKGRKYDGRDDNDEPRRRPILKWILLTLFVMVVLAFAGLYALHKYKPASYDRMMGIPPPPVALKKPDTIRKKAPADTAKKIIVDTTAKAADSAKLKATDTAHAKTVAAPLNSQPAVIDTFAVRHYEVIGTSVATVAEAAPIIRNYKSIGIDDAHVLTGPGSGVRKKISLKTFFNRQDAVKYRKQLIASGKVKPDIYVIPINPTK